ncbi:TasA family protein [Geodermatophilus sp. URMC 64]
MRINRPGRARTARKVAGSVAVLGVAAAVAGLGTYSTFTDSTSPVNTGVATGVLSLSLNDGNGAAAVQPFPGGGLMAGDSVTQALDLVNDGSTAFGSVTMKMSATASTILDTDTTTGLQLSVKSCSVAWSGSGASSSCAGSQSSVYSGPIVMSKALTGAASLAPGGVDHLLLTASLPASANGSAYQGKASTLSLVFDGVQRAGAGR